MNSLRDAIKSRRGAIVIKLDPENMEVKAMPEHHKEIMGNSEMNESMSNTDDLYEAESPVPPVPKKDDSEAQEELSPGGEVTLSTEDIKKVKQLIASGREPASIQERMLLEQYKLQGG